MRRHRSLLLQAQGTASTRSAAVRNAANGDRVQSVRPGLRPRGDPGPGHATGHSLFHDHAQSPLEIPELGIGGALPALLDVGRYQRSLEVGAGLALQLAHRKVRIEIAVGQEISRLGRAPDHLFENRDALEKVFVKRVLLLGAVVERLLGVPIGSMPIIDNDTLIAWFDTP